MRPGWVRAGPEPGPHRQRPAMRETPRPAGETLPLVAPERSRCPGPGARVRAGAGRWARPSHAPRPQVPRSCRAGPVSPSGPGPRAAPGGSARPREALGLSGPAGWSDSWPGPDGVAAAAQRGRCEEERSLSAGLRGERRRNSLLALTTNNVILKQLKCDLVTCVFYSMLQHGNFFFFFWLLIGVERLCFL